MHVPATSAPETTSVAVVLDSCSKTGSGASAEAAGRLRHADSLRRWPPAAGGQVSEAPPEGEGPGLEAETTHPCSGPRTRRSSLCFSLFVPIWQRLEVSCGAAAAAADTEAFVCTSVHGDGGAQIPPSHDSKRGLCASLRLFFSSLFMSLTGGEDPTRPPLQRRRPALIGCSHARIRTAPNPPSPP